MDEARAIAGFAALAQETRLRIVRQLVGAGDDGMPAGDIAVAMGVSPSNMSFHLKELERSGLVASRREARSIIYSAAYDTLGGLIRFLMEDCCSGRPEVCAPILAAPCCAARPRTRSRRNKEKAHA
jgi:DNA-binding transcriptional ArsR family regulator